MPGFNFSFRFKLIIGIAVIEVVLLSILIGHNIEILRQTNEREIENRARSLSGFFYTAAHDAVIATDMATLQVLSDDLQSNQGIRYVHISDPDEIVLAASKGSKFTSTYPKADRTIQDIDDGIFDLVLPVTESGELFATIRLGIEVDAFHTDLRAAKNSSLLIALLGVLAVTFFSFILGLYLTRQLSALREGAKKISAGELGYQIEISGNDELSDTAKAFNAMSTQVKTDQSKHMAIMQSAIDMILTTDKTGNIIEMNPAAEKKLGFGINEIHGKFICDVIHPGSGTSSCGGDFRSYILKDMSFCFGQKIETSIFNHRHEKIPVEIVVTLTDEKELDPFYTFYISDISDRKAADELKDNFISTVSHELRTPLTAIQGALGLLDGHVLDSDSAEGKQMISTAYDNSKQLLKLVNDLLDVQKLDAGQFKLNPAVIDIIEIVMKSMQQNRQYAEQFSTRLEYSGIQSAVYVYADESRILQVLANLISNACKFSPKNDVVTVTTEIVDDQVRLGIADRGEGIADDFRERIFSKFSQGDSGTNRRYAGTGLGLNISQYLISVQHGKIDFITEKDIGTEFYFTLPVVEESADLAGILTSS